MEFKKGSSMAYLGKRLGLKMVSLMAFLGK